MSRHPRCYKPTGASSSRNHLIPANLFQPTKLRTFRNVQKNIISGENDQINGFNSRRSGVIGFTVRLVMVLNLISRFDIGVSGTSTSKWRNNVNNYSYQISKYFIRWPGTFWETFLLIFGTLHLRPIMGPREFSLNWSSAVKTQYLWHWPYGALCPIKINFAAPQGLITDKLIVIVIYEW